MKNPFIIAIAGYAGAGKDKFASLLEEQFAAAGKSVIKVSSGDLLRQYVRDNDLGDPGDRTLLQRIATERAATEGPNTLFEQALALAEGKEILLYPGIRQAPEVQFVHGHQGVLVVIDVPLEIRYQRSQLRARPGDEMTLEQFAAQNEIEKRGAGGVVQQIELVAGQADITVLNDGTLEQLERIAMQFVADAPDKLAKTYKGSVL